MARLRCVMPTDANLCFGPSGRFELQPTERRLLVDGQPANLGARAFDLLLELAARPGELRTKNELIEAVWSGTVVEEGNLATQISALRKILGSELIATIPGRGYRFATRLDSAPSTPSTPAAPAVPSPLTATPPAAPDAVLRTNLPAALPPLVGRSEDLAALHELLSLHRLVSIIGAGGMGKTTVALHLTSQRRAEHRHGVCWVELANVTDPTALPSAIAAAIGVRIGSADPLEGLCAALAPLDMLVVLDNAEQVVDGLARVVQAVLDSAPGLRVAVTSQVPLKLPGERAYRIGGLAVPQGPLPAAQALVFGAVALFVERAQAADARFVFTDAQAPTVIELCRGLDGLALAIELAAARAPMLGVQRLASAMDDRLRVLTGSRNRMAPARQQTLRATLEWSHGLLDPPEQVVFRRLSVFAGSASLTMVQRVLADPPGEGSLDEWAVLDALALLVDRSLVVAMLPDDGAEPRYRLLETPRLFAREQLQQAGEEATLRQRHAHAMAAQFDAQSEVFESGRSGLEAWVQAMAPDRENGLEALAWTCAEGDALRAAQIAGALALALQGGTQQQRIGMMDAVEPLIDGLDGPDVLARVMFMACLALNNNPDRALILVRRAAARLPVAPSDASPAGRWAWHRACALIASMEARAGDLPTAQRALAQARLSADPAWPAVRARRLAEAEQHVAMAQGDMDARLAWNRRLNELDASTGTPLEHSLHNLADAELGAGHAERAVALGTELVALLAGGRDEMLLTSARLNLSAALLALSDPAAAAQHLRAGWAQAGRFGQAAFFADYLSLLAALEGRMGAASHIAGHADAANARHGRREPNEAAAIARASQLARAALGDAEFDRLHAEGTRLREADITALAFPAPSVDRPIG